MRLMATTARCETLETELSDNHKHLQERIREASTMRRLLTDTEGSQDVKFKEVSEKLAAMTEERDQLEAEAAQLVKRRNRELDGLKARIRELEESLDIVQQEKSRYHKDISELRSSRSHADEKLAAAEQEAEEAREVVTQLKENLSRTEAALKQSTRTIASLKKVVEESQSRVDKLYLNQTTLNNDIKALQAEKAKLKQQLDASGGAGAQSGRSSPAPLSSPSSPARTDSANSASAPNIPYIRNVLLGFLEHKEQRQMLMPVVKTVLGFQVEDEKRLWAALGK